MDTELTHFLGREPYERLKGDVNHRNGSCERNFTLAIKFFDQFTDKWKKDLPSAAKCLDTSIEACLTFF